VEEICVSLPAGLRAFAENRTLSDQWDDECEYVFPSLAVSPAVGQWQPEENDLLSLETSEFTDFETLGKKDIYFLCVKVLKLRSLAGLKVSRWTDVFGVRSSPKGCWRSLYEPPGNKRTGDLQWRIVQGAIATNGYLMHLDPNKGDACPFCSQSETVFHLFVQCPRLEALFRWFKGFGQVFSFSLFIFGPRYCAKERSVHQLISFVSGIAKLAIWKTRKNRVRGQGSEDVVAMVTGLMSARLRVDFNFYKLTGKTQEFVNICGVKDVLYSIREHSLILNFVFDLVKKKNCK